MRLISIFDSWRSDSPSRRQGLMFSRGSKSNPNVKACVGMRGKFLFPSPKILRESAFLRASVAAHNYYYLTVFVIGKRLGADREHFLCSAPQFLAWPQKRAHQSKHKIRTLILFYRKHTGLLFRGRRTSSCSSFCSPKMLIKRRKLLLTLHQ